MGDDLKPFTGTDLVVAVVVLAAMLIGVFTIAAVVIVVATAK